MSEQFYNYMPTIEKVISWNQRDGPINCHMNCFTIMASVASDILFRMVGIDDTQLVPFINDPDHINISMLIIAW